MCALQEIIAEMKRFSGNLEGPKITRAITKIKINVEEYLNEQK